MDLHRSCGSNDVQSIGHESLVDFRFHICTGFGQVPHLLRARSVEIEYVCAPERVGSR